MNRRQVAKIASMRALVLDGDWAPRPNYVLTSEEAEGRWAREANKVWRHPRWELRDIEIPVPRDAHEVLIRVRNAGIAVSTLRMTSTDEEGYVLLPYRMAMPVIPGHEFAGEVVDVGPEVTRFSIGDPVAVEALWPCERCVACLSGRANYCQVGDFAGFTRNGGLAEYAVVPSARLRSLVGLRERVAEANIFELGVVCEPAAIAYVGMFQADKHLKPGMSVAVFGAGPIGQAAVALSRCAGASMIYACDPFPARRELARILGADIVTSSAGEDGSPEDLILEATSGRGVDLIVDATGDAPAVLPRAQAAVATGGHILQLGVGSAAAELSTMSTMVRGATHTFSMGHLGGFEPVIELLASGRLNLQPMVGARSNLNDALDVLGGLEVQDGGKNVIVMPAD